MKGEGLPERDRGTKRPAAPSRDRLISAVYETVIRPELYDTFLQIWEDHIRQQIEAARSDGDEGGAGVRLSDPVLEEHFERAYSILEQFGRTGEQDSVLDRIRDTGGLAMAFDAAGAMMSCSDAARQLLDGQDSIAAVEALVTADAARLLRGLRRAARDGIPTGAPVVLATGGHPHHLIGRVAEATSAAGGSQHLIIVEGLDFHWNDRAEPLLAESFGLSPAEIEIVRHLLSGLTLRDIARQSGRSEHTVRNQAKAVLAKTGAPGQVDLIRLVAFLLAEDDRDQDRIPDFDHLPSQMLRMDSGLSMQVFHAGAESGRPVIYVHGLTEGPAPIAYLDGWLKSQGIRVIAPARPGFGHSDAIGDPQVALDRYVSHVSELIDRMGLKRPAVLGHMAGCLFACVLADRLADRVAGAVLVSASAPIARLTQIGLMPRRQRVLAYTARFAPALLPTVIRAGIAQVDSAKWPEFMDALYPPGTNDHEVIRKLGLAELIHAGYRFTAVKGPTGFAADSHHVVRDWRKLLSARAFPSVFVCGAEDPVVPVATLQETLGGRDGVEIVEVAGSAQLVLYERPAQVFEAVARIAGWPG